MTHNPFRYLLNDLSDQPGPYRLHPLTGPVNLRQLPERVDAFTLSGPAGTETFVIHGPRAFGRGGSFNLLSPSHRHLLLQTVAHTTLCADEYLGLHPELNDAGFTLTRGQVSQCSSERLTPLCARHPDGRVLWFHELLRQPFGLPLEQYVHYGAVRLAALRHHEPASTVTLMAQSDEALRAQGLTPDTLPALLMVSAWLLRSEALEALLDGEIPDAQWLPPSDFEWHPVAYQQLHLSLTRSDLRQQPPPFLLAQPA
ncbi:hypothetical protein GO986_05140 [Deinococcus sp. HMF7620]|uniref:Uncharacterized protein n=1 Tax=Deinococcus arboris TaxID=2682977 RepID=A0A7C9MQ23_9DEIO|nr:MULTISPECIES: hypothetical protein [Deinococcus]MBZ9749656.1 hypothetical protein [Deinococcus betulae]MVN86144.1 hypothetical protein [Deinococcus arboris]